MADRPPRAPAVPARRSAPAGRLSRRRDPRDRRRRADPRLPRDRARPRDGRAAGARGARQAEGDGLPDRREPPDGAGRRGRTSARSWRRRVCATSRCPSRPRHSALPTSRRSRRCSPMPAPARFSCIAPPRTAWCRLGRDPGAQGQEPRPGGGGGRAAGLPQPRRPGGRSARAGRPGAGRCCAAGSQALARAGSETSRRR